MVEYVVPPLDLSV